MAECIYLCDPIILKNETDVIIKTVITYKHNEHDKRLDTKQIETGKYIRILLPADGTDYKFSFYYIEKKNHWKRIAADKIFKEKLFDDVLVINGRSGQYMVSYNICSELISNKDPSYVVYQLQNKNEEPYKLRIHYNIHGTRYMKETGIVLMDQTKMVILPVDAGEVELECLSFISSGYWSIVKWWRTKNVKITCYESKQAIKEVECEENG